MWLSNYLSAGQDNKIVDRDGFLINQYTVLGRTEYRDDTEPFEFLAVPHMIIVKEITEEIVHKTLKNLDENDEIIRSTIKL